MHVIKLHSPLISAATHTETAAKKPSPEVRQYMGPLLSHGVNQGQVPLLVRPAVMVFCMSNNITIYI